MTENYLDTGIPGDDELLFLPLGGAGEIGMNLNLYGHKGQWLMVDLGITFGDDTTPGVDVITPDPTFIAEYRDILCGVVLTHAHEDHIGAVQHLWPQLRCPIYATSFTASLLRRKLTETSFADKVPINKVPLSGYFSVGPFELELVTLTHSIPEPNAVIIRTDAGTVMHTGDWKLDPDPLIGEIADEKRLAEIGREGVLAMVCDSTNVFVEGEAGSEATVRKALMEVVGQCEHRVAVGCFASNIARLDSIARVGEAHGREVALVGRSLWRIYEVARENGYLTDIPGFLTPAEASELPREKVLMICTGSQGEPRAALARIAARDHRDVALDPGDTVVFSSRVIPGKEKSVGRLQNQLATMGVRMVGAGAGENAGTIHVSGHPARDELARMYQWIRPEIAVPVHGEMRHMREHADLARDCQVRYSRVVRNGDVLRLAPGNPEILDEVHAGRLALDGKRLVPLEGTAIRARRRATFHGSVVATIVVDAAGYLCDPPLITANGVYDEEEEGGVADAVADAVVHAAERLGKQDRMDNDILSERLRRALRRSIRDICGKHPETEIHLVRL